MTSQTPPGWYPDPYGTPGLQRYWDGNQWTQVTQPADEWSGGAQDAQGQQASGYPPGGSAEEQPKSEQSGQQAESEYDQQQAAAYGQQAGSEYGQQAAYGQQAGAEYGQQQAAGYGYQQGYEQQQAPGYGYQQPPGYGQQQQGWPPPGGGAGWTTGGQQGWPPQQQPTSGKSNTGLMLALAGGGFVVVALIVVVALFATGIIGGDDDVSASGSSSTGSSAPSPEASAPGGGGAGGRAPVTGTISDPRSGLSYAQLGGAWEAPQTIPPTSGLGQLGFSRGSVATVQPNYDGDTSYVASVYSGALSRGGGSLEQSAKSLFTTVYPDSYPTPNQRRDLESKAYTVSGKQAWIYKVELSFPQAETKGWNFTKETAVVVTVEQGSGRPPSMLYISIPDSHKTPGDLDLLLSSLKAQ